MRAVDQYDTVLKNAGCRASYCALMSVFILLEHCKLLEADNGTFQDELKNLDIRTCMLQCHRVGAQLRNGILVSAADHIMTETSAIPTYHLSCQIS